MAGNRTERLDLTHLPWAVLAQAVDDASLMPANGAPPRGPRKPGFSTWSQKRDARIRAEERREAILFLTGDGEWGLARELWCDMAGLDGDVLREKVIRLLAEAHARRLSQVRVRVRPAHQPTHQPTRPASHASHASLPPTATSATGA